MQGCAPIRKGGDCLLGRGCIKTNQGEMENGGHAWLVIKQSGNHRLTPHERYRPLLLDFNTQALGSSDHTYITSFRKWFVEPNDTQLISMPSMGSCVSVGVINGSISQGIMCCWLLAGYRELLCCQCWLLWLLPGTFAGVWEKGKKSVSFDFGQHCSLLKMTWDENTFCASVCGTVSLVLLYWWLIFCLRKLQLYFFIVKTL